MTCQFFRLLPSDLQIDILHAWLNVPDCGSSLLKVLSALEVACGKSKRSALRFLMGQLPLFGEWNEHQHPLFKGIKSVAQCLQWLAARSVRVRALVLAGSGMVQGQGQGLEFESAAPILPLIDTLHWKAIGGGGASILTSVLACLPNLTTLHVTSRDSSSMGLTVDTSLTPMLSEIAIAGHLDVAIAPHFADSCPQLRVLRVGQLRLTDELADWLVTSCPNLQLLEVSMKDVDANNLHRVLGLCSRLSELVVFDVGILVGAVVALCRSLRRLTCNGQDKPAIATLIAVSELSSHLEYFKWDAFVFSPKDGRLELPATYHDRISTAQLSSILGHYSSLERFHLESALSGDMVPLLADKFAGTLRHLSVDACFGCGNLSTIGHLVPTKL